MKKGLFEKLKEYGESDYYPFHMPGHKRNSADGFWGLAYQYDITEIDGFDNLHQAHGILREAQEHAAALYRSEETYFLINGSTAGILSSVSAVAGRGKKLIIARNCHKAVYHAAFLNQLETEYIYPDMIEEFGISGGIRQQQIEAKIDEIAAKEKVEKSNINTVIAGIVLTSPTYDGILSDVAGIVKTAHSYGIPVIVDQAHGAHFGFHPMFPLNAVAEGADIVIHSVHKTLPSPTQTALLHKNGFLVSSEAIRKYLRIYQSSSPSYLLMAGIDNCMHILEKEGQKRLDDMLCYRREFIKKTEKLKYIRIYSSTAEDFKEEQGHFSQGMEEPGRLLISVKGTNITGRRLYDTLRETYHLQMEMCGGDYVIAILSMMDKKAGFDRLADALNEIDEWIDFHREEQQLQQENFFMYQQHQPETALKLSDAFMAEGRYMPLEETRGKTAADFVNIYPPGIPILVPGEIVDDRIIQVIKAYLDNGYTVQGIESGPKNRGCNLKVLK